MQAREIAPVAFEGMPSQSLFYLDVVKKLLREVAWLGHCVDKS